MKLKDSVAFVTGANRGLGLAYAKGLRAAGAKKVYAGARDPASVNEPGLIPVRLDVNDPVSIKAAAEVCSDVDLLINNAGILDTVRLLDADGERSLRDILETNVFGVLAVSRAFAPVLARNGGGALVNMLSVLSWASLPLVGPYSVSKSAAWGLTNALRNELRAQGTLVVGVHAGYIDTDLIRSLDAPKAKPEDIVRAVIAGIEADAPEVLTDDMTRAVKQGLSTAKPMYLG